jgi:hypothetical protein
MRFADPPPTKVSSLRCAERGRPFPVYRAQHFLIGLADRRLRDGWMLTEDVLNFAWIDVESTCDSH